MRRVFIFLGEFMLKFEEEIARREKGRSRV